MSTILEIARRTGYSKSTISRVINNDPNVNEKTRENIQNALKEYGYVRNELAKGLKSKSNLIGIIIEDIRNSYNAEILYFFFFFFSDKGYSILFMNSDGNADTERHNIDYLLSLNVSGIIIMVSFLSASEPYIKKCVTLTNVVAVGNKDWADTIDLKLDKSVNELAKYVKKSGHTQIGICNDGSSSDALKSRRDHIEYELEKQGLKIEESFIYDCPDYLLKMECAYKNGCLPTLVIAFTDNIALDIYIWCKKNGLRIPEDLSVIGFDDTKYSKVMQPPLTTIAQPIAEIAKKTSDLLLDCIKNDKAKKGNIGHHTIYFDTEFIIRDSVCFR